MEKEDYIDQRVTAYSEAFDFYLTSSLFCAIT
jgi:hypothetical protein